MEDFLTEDPVITYSSSQLRGIRTRDRAKIRSRVRELARSGRGPLIDTEILRSLDLELKDKSSVFSYRGCVKNTIADCYLKGLLLKAEISGKIQFVPNPNPPEQKETPGDSQFFSIAFRKNIDGLELAFTNYLNALPASITITSKSVLESLGMPMAETPKMSSKYLSFLTRKLNKLSRIEIFTKNKDSKEGSFSYTRTTIAYPV